MRKAGKSMRFSGSAPEVYEGRAVAAPKRRFPGVPHGLTGRKITAIGQVKGQFVRETVMNLNAKRVRAPLIAAAAILVLWPAASVLRAQTGESAPKPKTTQEAYKNIQVLKDLPPGQLIPAMQFITASLGVECDFCHVRGAFDKDDKATKQTARKMMQMMFALNQQNFDRRREVTCYSCHRGIRKPLSIPMVGDTAALEAVEDFAPSPAVKSNPATHLPEATEVLDKYVAALGGTAAIEKISSRVGTGKVTFAAGPALPVQISWKVPGKQIMTVHLPLGDSTTAWNGNAGWLSAPGAPVRETNEADFEGSRLDADLQLPIHLKQLFSDIKVIDVEKIRDHDAVLLLASNPGQSSVELFFDQDSGLLLRQLRFSKSPLGLNPTRIDYDDYKDFDGVKVPLHLTIARPITRLDIQFDQVSENVPVDDAQFEAPPPPAKPQQP
jgi:photosynthetic reaction center cytochrome c subunit